jgi:formylglycine-generating enzyme required for sulfatase activity
MRRALPFLALMALTLLATLLSVLFFPSIGKESHSQSDASTAQPIETSTFNQRSTEETIPMAGALPQPDPLGTAASQTNTASLPDLVAGASYETNAVAKPEAGQGQTTSNDLGSTSHRLRLSETNDQDPTPPEWVWIPPGQFVMGSPEAEPGRTPTEPGRRSNEGPQTEVTITYGYWLGKYEVTFGQFYEVTGKPASRPYPRANNDANRTLANVSWNEARRFCAALTVQERKAGRLPEGYVCRLPTEAEWEYACRAGTTTRFSFGEDDRLALLDSFAWYGVNSGGSPQPVGGKQPNPWGLFDMHGNVSEWCLDYLGTYPGGNVTNLVGEIGGRFFTYRGGNWQSYAESCRSAWRHSVLMVNIPEHGAICTGFRVALAPPLP